MTEQPTSHEGRQPLAARPQERTRPRQEAGSVPVPQPTAPAVSGPVLDSTLTARREGDRLRFVGAATRRIARGIDLDEIVLGLCRATVPTFSDAILVYLRDPLPVGDERPVGPVVLRLRRTDRIGCPTRTPRHRAASRCLPPTPQLPVLDPQSD